MKDNSVKVFFVSMLIVILDQLTKYYIRINFFHGESFDVIDGLFSLTFVKNKGVAFGLGGNAPELVRIILFNLVPLAACCWLLYAIFKFKNLPWWLSWAYGLIFSGALGNLIDRVYLGYVVDFLDFYYQSYHFWTFNIADSAITAAAFLLIYDFFIDIKSKKTSRR